MKECERIIKTLEHFYGHLEIECCGSLGLCSVECKEDAKKRGNYRILQPDLIRLSIREMEDL